MTKFLIFNRQRFIAFLFYLFFIFLALLIFSCGDGSYNSDSSETASAFFTIEWHDTPASQSSENTRIVKDLDCEAAGVDEITCDVYDGSSTYLTSGGPWDCLAGSGTTDNIPVGQGRVLVVLGFDNGGNILYHGKITGITITAGPPTNVGTIDAYYFVPSGLEATTVSGRQIDLSWNATNENVSVAGYRIYRDGDQVGTSASPSYSDTDLDPSTEYCYTVSAYDAFDNESRPSNQDCATTLESFDWYRDADEDGYGDPNDSINSEAQPEGYVSDNTDCNDNDASIHPGATEVCNGIDDDCDGNIDEGVLNTYYRDADGDGYGNAGNSTQDCSRPSGYVTNSSDCNDNDASIHPGATEVCNGIDDDCDGNIDEGLLNTYYRDADGDGYGNAGNSTQDCSRPSGYVINSSDCNDNDASIHPGATEVCNGIDDDCDGEVDDGLEFNTYYRDADGDGYGNAGNSIWACSRPSGYVTNRSDCDDGNYYINPGVSEVCGDEIDNDCDGDVNENCIPLTPTLYTPAYGAELDNGCDDYSDLIVWDFDWSSVQNATYYQIYVIGDGETVPAIDEIVTSSSYHFEFSGYAYVDDWTWYVRAGNDYGWSVWSEGRYFYVEPLNTDCPDDITGTWYLDYDWGCDGSSSSATWYINYDGTFTDSSEYYGTWSLNGSQFTLTYYSGTTYTGVVSGDYMYGTMVSSYDGSTGCWSADKEGIYLYDQAIINRGESSADPAGNPLVK